jgi:hypothetical protein
MWILKGPGAHCFFCPPGGRIHFHAYEALEMVKRVTAEVGRKGFSRCHPSDAPFLVCLTALAYDKEYGS